MVELTLPTSKGGTEPPRRANENEPAGANGNAAVGGTPLRAGAGRHPGGFHKVGTLKFWLADKKRANAEDPDASRQHWLPLNGPMSFVEQIAVLFWALRILKSNEFKSYGALIGEVHRRLTLNRSWGPTKGERRQRSQHAKKSGKGTSEKEKKPKYYPALTLVGVASGANRCVYEEAHLLEALAVAITVVGEELALSTKKKIPFAHILTEESSPTKALVRILVAAGVAAPLYDSDTIVAPRIRFAEGDLDPGHPLADMAQDIFDELTLSSGARVIFLRGAPFSGKTLLCQYLFEKLQGFYNHLVLDDGSALPLVAMSLDDFEPRTLVDEVAGFFLDATRASDQTRSGMKSMTDAQKLSYLESATRKVPIILVVTGRRRLGSNPIVSALRQDLIGELIDIVLSSNPLNRVITTGEPTDGMDALTTYRGITTIPVRVFILSDLVTPETPLPKTWQTDPIAQKIVSWGQPMNGLTVAMSLLVGRRLLKQTTAVETSAQPDGQKQSRAADERRHREGLWNQDAKLFLNWKRAALSNDAFSLLELLWRDVLDNQQKMLIGIVAACHDGLQLSTLQKILRAIRAHTNLEWDIGSKPLELVPTTLLEADTLRAELQKLRDLIHERETPEITANGLPNRARQEPIYSLLNWRRRAFLALWFDTKPRDARLVMWFIAREAAERAQQLEVASPDYHHEAIGRHAHSLNALLGSLDPAHIVKDLPAPTDAQLMLTEEKQWHAILPPLSSVATPAPGWLSFKFAWETLYVGKLDEGSAYFPSLFADSEIRVASLLAFFELGKPWVDITTQTLRDKLTDYPHIATHLMSPPTVLKLLTQLSRAALRLRRLDLVAAAARMGEHLMGTVPGYQLPPEHIVELLVTEIEASILLGRPLGDLDATESTPGAILSWSDRTRHGLGKVLQRIDAVLSSYANEEKAPHGYATILMRRGEVLSLRGEVPRALNEFEKAAKLEQGLNQDVAHNPLAGRPYRRFARALIRRARQESWRASKRATIDVMPVSARSKVVGMPVGIPLPPPVPAKDPVFKKVRKLIAENNKLARSPRAANHAGERVGSRILEACAHLLRHDYPAALRTLQDATAERLSPALGVELFLDLWGVRAQVMIDASLHLIAFRSDAKTKAMAGELSRVLGKGETDPIETARLLLEGADSTLVALRELSEMRPFHFEPCIIFTAFLTARRDALAACLEPVERNRSKKFEDAALAFTHVARLMRNTGYHLFLRETQSWRDGLLNVLERSQIAPG